MKKWRMVTQMPVAVICFGLIFSSSSAQRTSTGEIRGQVVDIAGATIKGASVFIHKASPSEDAVQLVAHTDIHGDFVLHLPEGGYDILVTSPGFASGLETVGIFSGKSRKIRWKLKPLGCDIPGMNCDTFQ